MRDPVLFEVLVKDCYGREWDVRHYLEVCSRHAGPVLELGVGSGRLFEPLTRAGHEVWGIDIDERMLGHARTRARAQFGDEGAGRLINADARDFGLERRFGCVLASYNFFALVRPGDLATVSHRIEDHLSPGGILAFDFIVADAAPWGRMAQARRSITELTVDGERVEYEVTARFDPETRLHTLDEHALFPDGRTVTEHLCLYQWRVNDLISQLQRLGWDAARPARDDTGEPYGKHARVYCGVLARSSG